MTNVPCCIAMKIEKEKLQVKRLILQMKQKHFVSKGFLELGQWRMLYGMYNQDNIVRTFIDYCSKLFSIVFINTFCISHIWLIAWYGNIFISDYYSLWNNIRTCINYNFYLLNLNNVLYDWSTNLPISTIILMILCDKLYSACYMIIF